MCGICGIVYNNEDKLVEKDILNKMNASLIHRGPDEDGYFIKGNVGLGIRRLSIIDVKGGHQPIYNENKTICVICNGEIYNYLELREDLKKHGHSFSTNSDVEVIVHLYEEDPENFMHKLRGMFAVAIYDSNKDSLILIRDRLGIKPLYYTYQKGVFLFASELKAILKYPGLEKEISLEALSDYLTYLYIPAPETIFESIYKLPPAHILTFSNGDIALRQYWEVDYQKQKENVEQYYIERLGDLLRESVRMHLMSEVPLGAFLSGGMDSSTIVALMSRVAGERVKTFSVGFDVPGFNELVYAEAVAKRFGTEHYQINLAPDIVNLLPKIVSHFDEPFADSSAIPTYLISEFAKTKVTVCLSGDGGDELFAGYGWTRRQKFIEDYNRLPKILRQKINRLFLGNDYLPDFNRSSLGKLKRFFYDAGLPVEQSFMRRKTCFSEEMKRCLFRKDIYEKIKHHNSINRISPYFKKQNIGDLEKLLFADTKSYLPEDCLRKVDMMSMMHSLEVRVPFLDHKVVEFVVSMPFKYKMRRSISKYILKKSMRGILPKEILKQRKLGFSIPLNLWFRSTLKGTIDDFLLAGDSGLDNYFDSRYIKNLISEHINGRQDFGNQIFSLLILELWFRNLKN